MDAPMIFKTVTAAFLTAAFTLPAFAHRHYPDVIAPLSRALPNAQRTPGVIDPRVTQANLDQTICRRGGYMKSVRPAESYTEALKRKQIRQYGYRNHYLHNYEENHLISLELGAHQPARRTSGPSLTSLSGIGVATPRTGWKTSCTGWSVTTRCRWQLRRIRKPKIGSRRISNTFPRRPR